MSIRTALIGGISLLLVLSSAILAFVGIRAIRESVVQEAQARVDHDLFLLASLYEKDLALDAERFRAAVEALGSALEASDPGAGDPAESRREELGRKLHEARRRLGFAVLSVAGPDGRRTFGTGGAVEVGAGIGFDGVIRSALEGEPSHGTVLLSAGRLRLEGGGALAASQRIPAPEGAAGGGTEDALFQWHAVPWLDAGGRVAGVVYGGRPINHDHQLIDGFARTLFGERLHRGKPLGTVTVFLGDTRVATNVRDETGGRALGTRVSEVVREHVLEREERWHDRAWVVDAWYLSGYQPFQSPDGETLGMLYVGLLEAPYDELQVRMIRRFAVPALLLLVLALVAAVLVVRRIIRPLESLRQSAEAIAEDGGYIGAPQARREHPVAGGGSYLEIASLSEALVRMQAQIRRRDRDLRSKNAELSEANQRLEQANENYMSTLGFVTHELKAPLANMQSYLGLVVDGFGGALDEKGKRMLLRVRRNCEDLQGMVKDYLDLSRAERGGLEPKIGDVDLFADVIEPSAALVEGLFRSRDMGLEVAAFEPITVKGDPELLRIAVTNLLNNAAKYGRDGGRAALEIEHAGGEVVLSVWNQGEGFAAAERERLFAKFSRLRNANTKSKKGSGLGLFLTAQIVERHGGRVDAESESGEWARFSLRLPSVPDRGTERVAGG